MATVNGIWTITIASPMGARSSTVELAESGGALTGKVLAPENQPDIAQGKIDGNAVSWTAEITNPISTSLEFAGTVEGDKISGTVKAGAFGVFPFSGARA